MSRYKVYFLLKDMKPVYIGHTKHVGTRILLHKKKDHNAVRVMSCKDKATALYYEKRWIRLFQPMYNKNGTKLIQIKPRKGVSSGEPIVKYTSKSVRISFSLRFEEFEKVKLYAHEQDRSTGNYISYAIARALRNDSFFIESPLEETKLRVAK